MLLRQSDSLFENPLQVFCILLWLAVELTFEVTNRRSGMTSIDRVESVYKLDFIKFFVCHNNVYDLQIVLLDTIVFVVSLLCLF